VRDVRKYARHPVMKYGNRVLALLSKGFPEELFDLGGTPLRKHRCFREILEIVGDHVDDPIADLSKASGEMSPSYDDVGVKSSSFILYSKVLITPAETMMWE